MARKKTQIIDLNTAQTRLEDKKNEYEFVQNIINELTKKSQKQEEMIVMNANGTLSPSPTIRLYLDMSKRSESLTKIINDMEEKIRNGNLKDEEDDNPFD